jgi:hypothetical protein
VFVLARLETERVKGVVVLGPPEVKPRMGVNNSSSSSLGSFGEKAGAFRFVPEPEEDILVVRGRARSYMNPKW